MNFGLRLSASLVVLAALASGCATLPPQQAFNREAVKVQNIQVLPLNESEVKLAFLNHPGVNFGLIGGLVAAADISSKENKLQEQVKASGLDHLAVFKDELTRALAERGYTLIWSDPIATKDKTPRDTWGLRKSYTGITGADAQLDLGMMFAGYATSGAGDASPYRPAVHISARLLDASGKQNLFTDVITYNNITNIATAITINPDPKFAYADFKQLEAAGPAVADGLRFALTATAQRLSEQL